LAFVQCCEAVEVLNYFCWLVSNPRATATVAGYNTVMDDCHSGVDGYFADKAKTIIPFHFSDPRCK